MPNFDRTGPQGKGPLTGRRRGRCAGNKKVENSEEEKSNSKEEVFYGRGRGGRPFGGGKGHGPGRLRRGFGNN
ncbi:MAG: DUF5320 domain-containing protein [Ignavibacteria bacterium]|jgi:hypothetical protein